MRMWLVARLWRLALRSLLRQAGPASTRHRHFQPVIHFTRRWIIADLHCPMCGESERHIFPCKFWRKGHVTFACECGARLLEAEC